MDFTGISSETLSGLGLTGGTLQKSVTTSGFTTGTGLVAFNLEPVALRLYPVASPLLNTVPRHEAETPGTVVQWKAITATNGGDPGVAEGNRNVLMTVTEQNYLATYKFLGIESSVTFQAQYAGKGFDNILGVADVNRLLTLMNEEERILLFGNSGNGTGNNGFQMASATSGTVTAITTPTGLNSFNGSVEVWFWVVPVTSWGTYANPIVVGSGLGLYTSGTRTGADGSTSTTYGGVGIAGVVQSGGVTPTSSQVVSVAVTPVPGAVAYAAYCSLSAATSSTAYFIGIFPSSTFTVSAVSAGTSPVGYSTNNQLANATGLNADNSANPLHFDGLFTWAVTGGYTQDLAGAGLTPDGQGGIEEIENVLQYLWNNFKVSPDAIIIGGAGVINSFTRAVLMGGSNGATKINIDISQTGNAIGGSLVTEYRAKYTGGPAKVMKVELHTWAPAGTIYFDLRTPPYQQSNVSTPREMDVMAEHFTIFWPLTTLKWTAGTYVFETLKHYFPAGTALITSVGSTLNSVEAA